MQYQLGKYFTSRVNTKNEHDQVVLHCREQLKGQEGLDCHFHLYKPYKTEKNRQPPPLLSIIWGYKWLFDCGLVLATKTFCSIFYLAVCAEVAPSRELLQSVNLISGGGALLRVYSPFNLQSQTLSFILVVFSTNQCLSCKQDNQSGSASLSCLLVFYPMSLNTHYPGFSDTG